MKSFCCTLFILLFYCCSIKNDLDLIDKVEHFKISECQNNCGIDSIGIRKATINNKKLKLSSNKDMYYLC